MQIGQIGLDSEFLANSIYYYTTNTVNTISTNFCCGLFINILCLRCTFTFTLFSKVMILRVQKKSVYFYKSFKTKVGK